MKRSRNGEPPGKKQQEIKVTAKTPYGVSKTSGGKVKLKNVKLDEPNDKYTPEKANVEYESAIKGGKMVSIYDKSVDPTTRKLVLGAIGDSDPLGKRTDIAIERGKKYTSYDQMYDVKGFNPEEFKAAARGKDFDKYLKQKGYSAGQSFEPNIGYYAKYETASDIKKQKDIEIGKMKSELGDPRKLKVGRLEQMKPGKVSAKTTGGLRMGKAESAPIERDEFTNPSKYEQKSKTRFRTAVNSVFAPGAGSKGVKLGNAQVAQKSTRTSRVGDYAREERQAKAYFGGGFEKKTYSDIMGTKEEPGARGILKKDLSELRAGIKSAKNVGARELVSGYRAAKKDVKAELKQTKLAGKYLKSLGKEYEGVAAGEQLNRTGKISRFTPERMAGFIGSRQDVFNKDANFDKYVRKSNDNAVNKNKTFGRKVLNANQKP